MHEAVGETEEAKRLREEREAMVREQLEKTKEKCDEVEKQKMVAELEKIRAILELYFTFRLQVSAFH